MIDNIGAKVGNVISAAANNNNSNQLGGTEIGKQFNDFLNTAIDGLKTQEEKTQHLGTQFVTGDLVDVHNVQISAEKALLGLELTVQVRNKVIEAYQEIMRTQL